jgi:hypothetical protein
MKRAAFILVLTLSFATASAFAGDPANDAKSTKTASVKDSKKSKAKTEQIALTGSYIKRDVRRDGLVTDGPNPLYVLDRKIIDTSGAADLSQVLIRSGFRH